jgi:hypothetical protein
LIHCKGRLHRGIAGLNYSDVNLHCHMNIQKPFRRVVVAAGLDPQDAHPPHAAACRHLVQAGVDLPNVQRISGHKTLQMAVRYSHQNGEHIRTAMDKLESRYRPEERTSAPVARTAKTSRIAVVRGKK